MEAESSAAEFSTDSAGLAACWPNPFPPPPVGNSSPIFQRHSRAVSLSPGQGLFRRRAFDPRVGRLCGTGGVSLATNVPVRGPRRSLAPQELWQASVLATAADAWRRADLSQRQRGRALAAAAPAGRHLHELLGMGPGPSQLRILARVKGNEAGRRFLRLDRSPSLQLTPTPCCPLVDYGGGGPSEAFRSNAPACPWSASLPPRRCRTRALSP